VSALWHALADPWAQDVVRRAALEVVLVGVTAGALGCWVVLGDLAYGAESLAHGLLPGLAAAALLVALAVTVLVAVQGLGNLLVVAVLVGPAAAARRHVRRMPAMMAVAAALAVVAGLGGLYLSYYAGVAAGAAIALLTAALWLAARAVPSRA
jgi:ABC-type Mn2+/Zn2+ transport system permease subunit